MSASLADFQNVKLQRFCFQWIGSMILHLEGKKEERKSRKKGTRLFILKILSGFCVNEQLWKQHLLLLPWFYSFSVNLHILSPSSLLWGTYASILMWFKKQTVKEMKGGWEERRGLRWPHHIEYFPVDFVEGFSAAYLNKQQHANEWRTSVIIYQTKNGGLWDRARGRDRGRERVRGSTILKIFWNCLSSNNYLTPVSI